MPYGEQAVGALALPSPNASGDEGVDLGPMAARWRSLLEFGMPDAPAAAEQCAEHEAAVDILAARVRIGQDGRGEVAVLREQKRGLA